MKRRSLEKELFAYIPLIFSGILGMVLILLFWYKLDTDPIFIDKISKFTIAFISINGFLATIVLLYLLAKGVFFKENRNGSTGDNNLAAQKMHDFRAIVELLLHSNMWAPGLKEYINDEFEGLTFFEMKEFYKGKSKLAIEFLQESQDFLDTENLYLELKSFLMINPKDKKAITHVQYPPAYGRDIIEKWFLHKCGSGLWYYFGYNFGAFKKALNVEAVPLVHQDKIIILANKIDDEVFEDSSFNEIFLAKLGDYVNKIIVPALYKTENPPIRKASLLTRYLSTILVLVAFFGVIIPLFIQLFELPHQILAISFGIMISVFFYVAISFYQFLDVESDL